MNIWNSEKLIRRFRNGCTLSETESIAYLLAFAFLELTVKLPGLKSSSESYRLYPWGSFAVFAFCTIAPILFCFYFNRKTREGHFIERYMSLGFLALLKSIIATLIFSALYGALFYRAIKSNVPVGKLPNQFTLEYWGDVQNIAGFGAFMGNVVYLVTYFILITYYFQRLSHFQQGDSENDVSKMRNQIGQGHR